MVTDVAVDYMDKIIGGVPELAWDLLCVDQQRRMSREEFTQEMIPWIRQRSTPYRVLRVERVDSGPLDASVEGAVVGDGGLSIPVVFDIERETIDSLWRVCHVGTPRAGEFMPVPLLADP